MLSHTRIRIYEEGETTKKITTRILKILKKRPKDSHKGDFGYLAVVGGSEIYTGAPYLVASAALRSGCDLVKVVSTRRSADIIASYSPNIITYPHLYDVEKTRMVLVTTNAMVIGNGMGKSNSVRKFIRKVVKSFNSPKVIDADGIYAIREMKLDNAIVTPHRREFEDLTGQKLMGDIKKDAKIVKEFSRHLGCILLVKGPVDIISDGRDVYLNTTGNPYMTKGGTGDVLAGIVGSFLAQGYTLLESACLGAYVSGKAGDKASEKYGVGLLATDIIEEIPSIFRGVL